MVDSPYAGMSDVDIARMYGVRSFSAAELATLRHTSQTPEPDVTPVVAPPPQVAIGTPPLVAPPTPIDPAQLAAVLYDKTIPIGFSTRAQWGGRIIEGPVFGVVNNERVVSFIAGYYIPINFWDETRTVSKLYFRGQLAWSLTTGTGMSGLNVGVATSGGNATVRFNTGTLSQAPDAWSIARYGADFAIAYVPLVTATFENIRIAQFDNTVPFTSVTVDDNAYGTPGDLVAWADAIEALAQYDGRGPDEFATVDVSGGLSALILGNNITFTDLLAAMRKHKPQWNVRTADKLYLVEKGMFSLDLALDRTRLVGHGAQPIVVHSSDAFDKPREKICHYLDVARDYEPSNVRVAEDIDPVIVTDSFNTDSYDIPVASTADVVMAETSFAYYTGEVARRQSEFSGMAYYLGLEPGDCYKWTTASGRALYHRVNEIVRRADFTVDVKGEGFLTCAIEFSTISFAPAVAFGSSHAAGDKFTANFGQSAFAFTPPTGFGNWEVSPGVLATFDGTATNATLSDGDLTATSSSGAIGGARSTATKIVGKFYFEVTIPVIVEGCQSACGIVRPSGTYTNMANDGTNCTEMLTNTGTIFSDNTHHSKSVGMPIDGDVIGVAIDLDNRTCWFRRNGGNWNGNATYDPAANIGGDPIQQ
jgi:putative tail protein